MYREIEKLTLDSILKLCNSAISLDISKLSTGVVIYREGKYESYTISVGGIDSEAKMRFQFKADLRSLVEGLHFELAIVEDAIGGVNFKTTRTLLALNTVLEELALEGVCTYDKFFRKGNGEWKKWLRKCYKVPFAPTHKHEIKEIMRYLGFENNCQDVLDAMGMLVGVLLEEKSDIKRPVVSKLSLSNFKVLCFSNFDDFSYSGVKLPIRDSVKPIDISKSFKREFESYVNADGGENIYQIEVKTELLGALLVKYKIPLDWDEVFIIAYKK